MQRPNRLQHIRFVKTSVAYSLMLSLNFAFRRSSRTLKLFSITLDLIFIIVFNSVVNLFEQFWNESRHNRFYFSSSCCSSSSHFVQLSSEIAATNHVSHTSHERMKFQINYELHAWYDTFCFMKSKKLPEVYIKVWFKLSWWKHYAVWIHLVISI